MPKESTLKSKASNFFDEENELLVLIPLHKWLLISACLLIFVVLPLLFIWSSLGIIHPPGYEQTSNQFADAKLGDRTTREFRQLRLL